MNQVTNLQYCESQSASGNVDDWVKLNFEPPDVSDQPPLPVDVRIYQGDNIDRKAYTSLKRIID